MTENKEIKLDFSKNWDNWDYQFLKEGGFSEEVIESVKEAKDFIQFYCHVKGDNSISTEHLSEICMITARYTDGVISLNSTLEDIADLIENPKQKDKNDRDINKENFELFKNYYGLGVGCQDIGNNWWYSRHVWRWFF